MKLTKGKLSKLFHKKKQTMRRYKNQRKYRRASKTFRQRKPLNLHRSSMKKLVVPRKIEWIGGTEPDEKVPLVVKPASDEPASGSLAEPVAQLASEPVHEPVAKEPVPEQVPQQVAEPATEVAPESVPQPVAEEQVPEPVAQQIPEQVSEPVAQQIPEQVSEPVAQQVSQPVPEPVPVAEESIPESDSKPIVEEPTPEPVAKSVEEPIVAKNVKQETSPVADALNLIADKIATAVVNKMRENPASSSSPNQDADIAVPLAVNAVVKQTQLAPE